MRLRSREASSVQEVSCGRRAWARPWPLGEGVPKVGAREPVRTGAHGKQGGLGPGGAGGRGGCWRNVTPGLWVIPGPSYWAPARSKDRALPFCRASLLAAALPGAAVAMATTEVLTC